MSARSVPDDVVRAVEVDGVRVGLYRDGVVSVTVRFVGGSIPLKVGERVEVEVVEIERSVVER